MQQADISKTLNGLSLSKTGNTSRSSVVERVKWIEKTHGSINGKTAVNGYAMDGTTAPRARLRLPKHFIDAQQQAASASTKAEETGISTKAPAALGKEEPLSPKQQQQQQQQQLVQSPAMSEATTVTEIKSPPAHSNKLSISSNESVSGILMHGRSDSNNSSDLEGEVCDPVHVNPSQKAVPPNGNPPSSKIILTKQHQHQHQRKPTIKKKNKEMPRSTKVSGNNTTRGLGMATRRQRQDTRRFDRSSRPANEEDRPTSSNSARSNHSANNNKPALVHSKSMGNVTNEEDGGPTSLLARLNERASCRPNLQDLVSNRSSPKFVKRSLYYSSTPLEDKKPIRDTRRFK